MSPDEENRQVLNFDPTMTTKVIDTEHHGRRLRTKDVDDGWVPAEWLSMDEQGDVVGADE